MAVFVHRLSTGGANTVLLNILSFFKDNMEITLVSSMDGPVGNLHYSRSQIYNIPLSIHYTKDIHCRTSGPITPPPVLLGLVY